MQNILPILRAFAGFWAPILVVSWVWYGEQFTSLQHIVMVVSIFSLVVAAITSESKYTIKNSYILSGIYIAGVLAVYIDITSYSGRYGPDYLAIAIKLMYMSVLVVVCIKAINVYRAK